MPRNKKRNVELPLAAWPELEILEREGAVRITGSYSAPSMWWSRVFPALTMMASVFLLPWSCIEYGNTRYGNWDHMTAADAGIVIGVFVVGMIALVAFCQHQGRKRHINVKVTPETIHINGRAYARGEGLNQFAIEEHEKAFNEAQVLRRGQGSRLYLDAMQVVMRYGEKRIPIADFNGSDARKAEALVVRLQTVDKGLHQLLGSAGENEAAAPGAPDDFGPAKTIR